MSKSLGLDPQGSKDALSRESRLRDLAEKKEHLQRESKVVAFKLEKLNYKIIQAQAEYGALYSWTAPILNLPTEILCRIFEAAHDASLNEGVPSNPLIEVIISHVCRRWRSIALSFPLLWSTFWHEASRLPGRIPIDRLVAYLDRSGKHLLNLHFAFAKSALREKSQALFNSMLENTISHAARWRRFCLSSVADVPILDFSDRLRQMEAPHLEYFSMCPNTDYPYARFFDELSPSVFLGGAPKLFYLRVDATCPSKYLPPLSNITVLRLEDDRLEPGAWTFGSFSTFLEILALPSLSSLSIVGQHFSEPDFPHSSKITMNNLKHLRYGDEHNLISHFLPFLFAPVLETLIISNVTLPSLPRPRPKFMGPFSKLRSLELIECLSFDDDSVYFLDFFRFLDGSIDFLAALTQDIIHLTITYRSGPNSLLQYIGEQFCMHEAKLWPKVKVLTGIPFDDDTIHPYLDFARMIENPELIIRTHASIVDVWKLNEPERYHVLRGICVVEELPAEKKLVSWPPGVDVPAEEDFFTKDYSRGVTPWDS